MAVKTFAVGELATSADVNEYLTNAGLVTVGGGTFTNVAAVEMTGFSSLYDLYDYRISIKTAGTQTGVRARIMNGATQRITGYYGASFKVDRFGSSGGEGLANNADHFYLGDVTTAPSNLITGSISYTSSAGSFNMTCHYMSNANVISVVGAYTNYDSFTWDRIRIYGNTSNITGSYQLMGVRKS
jgi:hypothetical protein